MTAGKQPRRVIRVLLLGEQHLVLDGLRLVLEQEEEFVVVRIGTTHDPGIADVIVFRASDDASYITGATLSADGGTSAAGPGGAAEDPAENRLEDRPEDRKEEA